MCLIKRYIVFECSMTKSELINCILQKMDKAMDPVRAQGAVNQILEYLAVSEQPVSPEIRVQERSSIFLR